MRRPSVCAVIAAVAAMLAASFGTPAGAQGVRVQFDQVLKLVSVDASRADVGRVVSEILGRSGARYQIDPGVAGRVSLSEGNVPTETALRHALSQVGASYELRNGIYRIFPGSARQATSFPWYGRQANLQINGLSVRDAANEIGQTYGVQMVAPAVLPGRVNINLTNATLDQALTALVNANQSVMPLGYRESEGTIIVEPVEATRNTPRAFLSRVGVNVNNAALASVLESLSRQANVRLRTTREVPQNIRISALAGNEPLWNVLQKIAIASQLKLESTGDREATFSPLVAVTGSQGGDVIGGVREAYGTCDSCGYRIDRDWRYCPMCGQRLGR